MHSIHQRCMICNDIQKDLLRRKPKHSYVEEVVVKQQGNVYFDCSTDYNQEWTDPLIA